MDALLTKTKELAAPEKLKISGSEVLLRCLVEEKVQHIFGYPGGAIMPVYDALYHYADRITHLLVRHEQAAGHMADGYSRSTGKTGVVLVTSGPGATNTVTPIATAYMDSIPMVIISGQVPSHLIGEDAFQETDMIGVSRPIVKHSFQIRHASEIPAVVKKAFYLASSGRPGPVVIDIPKSCTAPNEKFPYEYPEKVKLRSYNPPSRGHAGQIKKAVDELIQAKRPIIYTGGGVVQGQRAGCCPAHARYCARATIAPRAAIGILAQRQRSSGGAEHIVDQRDRAARAAAGAVIAGPAGAAEALAAGVRLIFIGDPICLTGPIPG